MFRLNALIDVVTDKSPMRFAHTDPERVLRWNILVYIYSGFGLNLSSDLLVSLCDIHSLFVHFLVCWDIYLRGSFSMLSML